MSAISEMQSTDSAISHDSVISADSGNSAPHDFPEFAERALGTPLGGKPVRVLFLGAGELGKEVAIELMRLGAWVCAADSYAGAPAQQVAHEARVLDMADPVAFHAVRRHRGKVSVLLIEHSVGVHVYSLSLKRLRLSGL